MANPLPNEKEIYEKISKEKLTVPEEVWELLSHHLGNDLYAISLIAGSYVTGEEKEPIPPEDGEKIIKHIEAIRGFLQKIKQATAEK